MENYLYGRQTTLSRLDEVRSDPTIDRFTRSRADKAYHEILGQLKDKKLMRLRERLIKATMAGDLHEVWKIENLMRSHEGKQQEKEE